MLVTIRNPKLRNRERFIVKCGSYIRKTKTKTDNIKLKNATDNK